MRVKELADLAGTTVRTIRYYHQIGLLPVPGVRDGRRDYDLVHVARLARIRWLAQAGVPLSRIAGMVHNPSAPALGPVDANRDSILTDLKATVVALDEQLEQLQAQRDRIRGILAAVDHDDHLSPMPKGIVRFYDDMEHRADDERVRRVIRRERDFMELAFYRGDMPPEVEALYLGFSDARFTESLALFGQVAARSDPAFVVTDEEIEQMSSAVVERLSRHLGADLPRVARSIDLDVARRAADLYVRLAGDHERRLGRAVADALLTALEKARS